MLDLNTATAAELDDLPELQGHGFEIVRYREERGRFDAIRQLEEVPGLAGKWNSPGSCFQSFSEQFRMLRKPSGGGLFLSSGGFGRNL